MVLLVELSKNKTFETISQNMPRLPVSSCRGIHNQSEKGTEVSGKSKFATQNAPFVHHIPTDNRDFAASHFGFTKVYVHDGCIAICWCVWEWGMPQNR
jgi:hypothetical protein